MNRSFFLSTLMVISAFFLTPPAFADHLAQCPSIENLNTLHYELSFPYGFDNHKKSMKFIALADQFSRGNDDRDDFVFVVYPVTAAANENPQVNLQALVRQLQPETAAPVMYHLNSELTVPMCVYTLPGHNEINALVYFDGGDLEPTDPMRLMATGHHHQQIKQMINHLFIK